MKRMKIMNGLLLSMLVTTSSNAQVNIQCPPPANILLWSPNQPLSRATADNGQGMDFVFSTGQRTLPTNPVPAARAHTRVDLLNAGGLLTMRCSYTGLGYYLDHPIVGRANCGIAGAAPGPWAGSTGIGCATTATCIITCDN